MKNKFLWLNILIIVIAVAFITGAVLIFPSCLREVQQRQIETASWDEVVGFYFVMPWAPFVLLLFSGLFGLYLGVKGMRLTFKDD